MKILQILVLAVVQGAAELLPVSSSAHVIVTGKLMGLDPTHPEMTFLLVMLHTGTMFAVLIYFWPRWKAWFRPEFRFQAAKYLFVATAATGVVGFGLKEAIEHFFLGGEHAEIESLFGRMPLMAAALFSVGLLIIYSGTRENTSVSASINTKQSLIIGIVQGLCLPFRGFSRSGATISAGLLQGVSRPIAEDFSFALAVVLTPPVIVREWLRLWKAAPRDMVQQLGIGHLLTDGLVGMVFSFGAGLLALRWLSSWLEKGRWKYFGYYCLAASLGVLLLSFFK
ncbi:MAG TPA: undecaprenyl-diphosphate phosphatase [bacterium]|nr:undecaprenyl-diphosphate phosphatase [bacterium]